MQKTRTVIVEQTTAAVGINRINGDWSKAVGQTAWQLADASTRHPHAPDHFSLLSGVIAPGL